MAVWGCDRFYSSEDSKAMPTAVNYAPITNTPTPQAGQGSEGSDRPHSAIWRNSPDRATYLVKQQLH
ncbi:hypothetical protein LC653_31005 [Nostoc sp. CHAB 5784]|uniref:hypothetical protein n=1 Tax=Nostoc mirabile TaxID=2907820 RepID=UPI001E5EF0C3|nr:hypothetical protein [Nostoc mirabile]MCC5668172.1 hypothetical protein [Nostoc mirabile CHAB5784]